MSNLTRWDPFGEMLSLRDAMNQLLEDSYVRPGTAGGAAAQGAAQGLALDVADRGDAYEVKASLPGVRPEDIHCAVQGDTLAIRGEAKAEQERREGNYLLRERRSGVMQRTISLPAPIESDAVEADYQDGVLTLRLPKAEQAKPKKIEVRITPGTTAAPAVTAPRMSRQSARFDELKAAPYNTTGVPSVMTSTFFSTPCSRAHARRRAGGSSSGS